MYKDPIQKYFRKTNNKSNREYNCIRDNINKINQSEIGGSNSYKYGNVLNRRYNSVCVLNKNDNENHYEKNQSNICENEKSNELLSAKDFMNKLKITLDNLRPNKMDVKAKSEAQKRIQQRSALQI